MKISKYSIATENLDSIVKYLNEHLSFDYENHSNDMVILASENFYFRNNSTQLNMIIVKQGGSSILIDIIGGGGGQGLFNINFGSEKGYIKKAKKVILQYIEEFNVEMEEL